MCLPAFVCVYVDRRGRRRGRGGRRCGRRRRGRRHRRRGRGRHRCPRRRRRRCRRVVVIVLVAIVTAIGMCFAQPPSLPLHQLHYHRRLRPLLHHDQFRI